jgi:hypothetical protein
MFARLMGLKTISPAVLHQLMQEKPVTLIDVNSERVNDFETPAGRI